MKLRSEIALFVWIIFVSIASAISVTSYCGCGPTTIQIKNEQTTETWQCEAKSENSSGAVNFSGCKRDGQSHDRDVQDSVQPDSGPAVDVKADPKLISLLN